MNGGEVLVRTLLSRDVDTAFFVPGGTFTTVLEALSWHCDSIRAIPMRLESSAAFAADAYCAIRKKPACVLVSRAPGATNAAIGIHTAMQASRPVVLFIANIPRPLKQREAFQEVDYRLMYAPIAKAVLDVHSFDELAGVAARAIDLSTTGRPGPVVVAVSRDILDGRTGEPQIPRRSAMPRAGPEAGSIHRAIEMLRAAQRPLVIAGEMVGFESANERLERFAQRSGAGVLGAYRCQDVLANSHPAWLGQLTLNRLEHLERALDECDLVIALGTRLDSVTTADYTLLRDHHRLIFVHPEPAVLASWQPDVAMVAHVAPALDALNEAWRDPPPAARIAWRDELHAADLAFAAPGDVPVHGEVDLAQVIAQFASRAPSDSMVVSDAGTFGRWLQRYFRHERADTAFGPMSGAMGYGVPGGVGAAVADPSRKVFVWVGDGGFLMTGHELASLVQERLSAVVIVCDNQAWGSILVHQHKRFPGWDFGTRLRSPDFAALGRGYGLASFTVGRTEAFGPALDAAMQADGSALIHLQLDARDASPYQGSAREQDRG